MLEVFIRPRVLSAHWRNFILVRKDAIYTSSSVFCELISQVESWVIHWDTIRYSFGPKTSTKFRSKGLGFPTLYPKRNLERTGTKHNLWDVWIINVWVRGGVMERWAVLENLLEHEVERDGVRSTDFYHIFRISPFFSDFKGRFPRNKTGRKG